MSQSPPNPPLSGIRVLDFTRMFAGPWSAEILSDLGAIVVKVEEPRIGDPTRRHRPLVGDESSYFMAVNRGKKSLAIDARTEEGREVLLTAIRAADVLVENFRPGVMRRLGLDYETTKKIKPDLVYCSLSGFGATGPMRERISFDIVNQAFAGLIDITGHPGNRASRIGVPIGDLSGGLYMSIAVLAGLVNRDATGLGCWIDLGLHDTLVTLLADVGQRHLLDGEPVSRMGNLHRAAAPYGCFPTRDGWIVLSAYAPADWERLVQALGLAADEVRAFGTPQERLGDQRALQELLASRLRQDSTETWLTVLRGHGITCAEVLDIRQVLESTTLASRDLVYEAKGGDRDAFRMLASPIILDGTRLGTGSVAPRLGEHTAEVLAELGYSADQVRALTDAGTVKVGP
ncbi:CoA transferase [Phytohabitans sp. ZYX-F-186]|uniref:CoA transferase n=1 Tax=Phytohabitans maris TaxID=3071409 RepID=A0ABU0ZHW1_9ACTN|nr:CoA transferase [Phytohabitans sp. ZYX-F-186]MDQ7905542.1 CoA transferase [Phytohabitans sp. ZYX-F-186]